MRLAVFAWLVLHTSIGHASPAEEAAAHVAAYEAEPDPVKQAAYLPQIVDAYVRANQCAQAKPYFDRYIELAPPTSGDDARRSLERYAQACESAPRLADAAVEPPPVAPPPAPLWPLQIDLASESHIGDLPKLGLHLSVSYVTRLAVLSDRRTNIFAGIGPAIRYVTWDNADDEHVGSFAPGVDLRIGVAFRPKPGALRLVAGVTPTWAQRVAARDEAGARGFGVRGNLTLACPGCYVSFVRNAAEGERWWIAWAIVLSILPTQVSYVVEHVPNATTHAFSIGWGL